MNLLKSLVSGAIGVTARTEFFWRIYRSLGWVHDFAARNRSLFDYELTLDEPSVPRSVNGMNLAGASEIDRIQGTHRHSAKAYPLLAYDVGMNNGDDTEYYLKKGLNVIGIEANTVLYDECKARFSAEINAGRLRIINCAVAEIEGNVNFFVNKNNHVLSTLVSPSEHDREWMPIQVPARRLSSLVKEYGAPHYIKIDVERYDRFILHDLLENSIVPTYISAESHEIDVFCHLVSMGYQRFKLVNGRSVRNEFRQHKIKMTDGKTIMHSFKHHSSGPFGDDIPSQWLNKGELLSQLIRDGLGWKDIHASR